MIRLHFCASSSARCGFVSNVVGVKLNNLDKFSLTATKIFYIFPCLEYAFTHVDYENLPACNEQLTTHSSGHCHQI